MTFFLTVAPAEALTAKIGGQTISDNVFPDLTPLNSNLILAKNQTQNSVKVSTLQSAATPSLLDLNVSFVSVAADSRTLQLSAKHQYTLTGPTEFTAHIGGKNNDGGSSYFMAFLGGIEIFDSRSLIFNAGTYGAIDYSDNHYLIAGTFGVAGSSLELELLAFIDVAAAKDGSFNASLSLNPSAVPDGGATALLLGFGVAGMALGRRKFAKA